MIAGAHTKLQAAHFRLAHSRAFYLRAYPTQTHEMPFDAHYHASGACGGVPERGIYGNMKTAVGKVGRGKMRTANQRFQAMASHYPFETASCHPAAGWEAERPCLMATPAAFGGFIALPKRVGPTSLATHGHNRYRVPAGSANQPVSLRVYPDRLVVVAGAGGAATPARVFNRGRKAGSGKTIYGWHMAQASRWRP